MANLVDLLTASNTIREPFKMSIKFIYLGAYADFFEDVINKTDS